MNLQRRSYQRSVVPSRRSWQADQAQNCRHRIEAYRNLGIRSPCCHLKTSAPIRITSILRWPCGRIAQRIGKDPRPKGRRTFVGFFIQGKERRHWRDRSKVRSRDRTRGKRQEIRRPSSHFRPIAECLRWVSHMVRNL